MAGKITALDLIKAHQTQKLMDAGSAVVNRNNETYKKVDETRKASTLIQNIADTPATALDMQKKKEDRAEGLYGTETERRARAARKALQEYKLTDEYRKNQKKIQQDQYVKGMLFGVRPEYEADDKEKKLQKDVDYWQGQVQQERDAKTTQRDMDAMESWSDEDKAALEQYINDKQSAFVQSLNPAATGLPADFESNPLIAKYGRARLDQIASSYQRMKNQQEYEAAQQTGRESADKGAIAAIGANAASIGANLADTLLNPLERIAQGSVGRDDRYSTLDPYAGGQAAAYAAGVREETAKNIAGSEEGVQITDGITGREALALGYQGGMAALDSGARALVAGTPAVGAGLAALGSFNQTLRQASEQGADPGQAIALATVNSAIEAATEKLPLDNLFDIARAGAKPAAKVIMNILKQSGIEILEEEASLVGTTLAEAAILQEESSYNQQVMQAMANGATEEEARTQANRALLAEAINTAIVSGISGVASAGGAEFVAARYVGNPETELQAQTGQQLQTAQTEAQEQLLDQMQQGTQEAQSQPEQTGNWMATTYREAMGKSLGKSDFNQTNAVSKPVESYPPEKQKMIRSFIQSVDQSIKGFVQRVKGGDTTFERKKITDVSDRAAKDIGSILGMDVSGYTHNINTNGIQHILKRHGENGKHDQSMSLDDDIARVGWVLENYDSVDLLKKDGKQIFSTEFLDRDGNPAPQIVFVKKIDGSYYVAETVFDNKFKKLWVQSVRLQKNNGDVTQTPAEGQTANHETNARSDFASPSPVNTIAENGPQVNGNLGSTQQVDTETDVQMGASNVQQQSPEGGQVKGIGAAEAGFSGKSDYQQLLYEGNVQPDRAGDVRPMEVPKTDGNGKRVTEFAANAYGAEVTTDEMTSTIESLIQDGQLGFDVRTNRESLETAAASIKKRGAAETRNQLTRNISKGKIRDGDIEQGILLYARYAEKGDNDNASELLVDLAQMANITGRNLQMFKLLRRMTVEGQVMTLQKEVRRTAESMIRSGQVKKGYEPSFDTGLMENYRKALEELRTAKTTEDQNAAKQKAKQIQETIYAAEAAKMPATFKAKWDAWRYMAMLGNAKTQVRNLAGNAMFMPYKQAKDHMAAIFEKALPKEQRTKALVQDPALLNWAREDMRTEDVRNALAYSAKLGDDVTASKMAETRKVFDSKALDSVRKFVESVPKAGDMLFKNDYYSRSLAGFLKARGYTADQIRSGSVGEDVLTEARTYAVKEAMKATFNDSNAFSDAIAGIGRSDTDNPVTKTLNAAAEGILPFRRTPANIMVRFTEYSPVGLAKGVWDMANHVRTGKGSAADAIDQLASGLTGTGMMYLGYLLAAGMNGVKLTGSGTDEDEKRQGHQDYALEFSADGEDYSYRIDWAAPANLPLFVGANIYNALQKNGADPDVSNLTAVVRGMGTMFEPMLALSCLSGLNDLVEGVRYAEEGEALYSIAADVTTGYFTQGIPALARQTAQAMQENKQTTFANDADPTVRDLQKTAANIPFVGEQYQTDKRNAWGEKEQQGDWTSRAFHAYFNPGSVKKIDSSPAETEINRLKEAQPESVTPPTASKILSYTDKQGNTHKDVRLTEQQYQTLAETQGKTAKAILDTMIASKDYAALTDTQKAEAIRTAYSYARKTGEIAAIGESHTGYSDAWMMEMEKGKEAEYIIRRVTKSELTGAMDALDTAWDKDYDQTGRSDDLKWAYDTFKAMTPAARKDVTDQITGTTAKYIEARDKGISHEAFVKAAENVSKAKGTGSNGTVRDIDRRAAIANTYGLTEKQIDTIMKAYMGDYDPENGKTEKSELKYDYIRQELGLSPKQYADTYRAHLDNSKKAKKIAAIMKLGYDKKTATALYKVYAGQTDVVEWYEKQ